MFRGFIVVFFAVFLAACDSRNEIGEAARSAVREGAVLVDVRTPQEFASGHLPGAINIPHGEIVRGIAALGLSASHDIVLYCRSGNRSGIAATGLQGAGFSQAMNAGGYSALKLLWDTTD